MPKEKYIEATVAEGAGVAVVATLGVGPAARPTNYGVIIVGLGMVTIGYFISRLMVIDNGGN